MVFILHLYLSKNHKTIVYLPIEIATSAMILVQIN
jgi:hypothetical protein